MPRKNKKKKNFTNANVKTLSAMLHNFLDHAARRNSYLTMHNYVKVFFMNFISRDWEEEGGTWKKNYSFFRKIRAKYYLCLFTL